MSRSVRGSKGPGYEYWGKRAWSTSKWLTDPGRNTKKLTSRRLRRTGKQTAASSD